MTLGAPRDTGPLSKVGSQVWRFMLLLGAVGGAFLVVEAKIVSIATEAAQEQAAPLRADIDELKRQSGLEHEGSQAMKRNIYRLCLASRVTNCEP